jgi:hypothetical protein
MRIRNSQFLRALRQQSHLGSSGKHRGGVFLGVAARARQLQLLPLPPAAASLCSPIRRPPQRHPTQVREYTGKRLLKDAMKRIAGSELPIHVAQVCACASGWGVHV